MKISARNKLKGTVADIKEGSVNCIVKLDIGGENTINSVITMASLKELDLKPGSSAYAIIKSSSVMIGTD